MSIYFFSYRHLEVGFEDDLFWDQDIIDDSCCPESLCDICNSSNTQGEQELQDIVATHPLSIDILDILDSVSMDIEERSS